MLTSTTSREGKYQELLGIARHSFVTYVVESSSPVVVDDADRKLLALFQEIWEKERYYVSRVYELLEKSGLRPLAPTYPIKASNYNFLRPMNLAEHWAEATSVEIARLEALKGSAASDDPSGRDFERLVDDFLALRRDSAKRVAEMRAALAPKPPPAPAAPAAAPSPPAAAKPPAPAAPAAPQPPASPPTPPKP